jgi:hypothetical protein
VLPNLIFSACRVCRAKLGLPANWSDVERWVLVENIYPEKVGNTSIMLKRRQMIGIPKLNDYRRAPANEFWSEFPKNVVPDKPSCSVNIKNFETIVNEKKDILTKSQLERAKTCIKNLTEGAPLCQKPTELPGCFVHNANSCYDHGQVVTETIASWVDKKYAAGPFSTPPMKCFRVNPLSAIDQGTKI